MLKYITEPFKHQHQVVLFGLQHKYAGILCDMGTGKTKAVIDVVRNRAYNSGATKSSPFTVLVVAPNSILENWRREVEIHSKAKAVVLRGTRKKRLKLLNEDKTSKGLPDSKRCGLWFYIVNYAGMVSIADELADKRFSMVVADESTYIKNITTKRAKALIKISRKTPYRIIMTGTPVTQSPLDIFAQFKFLDNGKIFGWSFVAFRNRFCQPIKVRCPEGHLIFWKNAITETEKGYMVHCPKCLCDYEVGKEAKAWEWELKPGALEELSRFIYTISIRYTKEECLDLPPKIYVTRHVELNPTEKKMHNDMMERMRTELAGKQVIAEIVLTKLLRLSQITSGYVKDEDGRIHHINGASKLKELDFLLDEISGQAIIWCAFKPNFDAITGLLDKRREKYVVFHGDVKPQDREEAIRAFQNGDARFFIGQPMAGGLGLNLTAASYVIYFSQGFSLSYRQQSEDRAHRIGQDKKLTIVDLVVPGTIDEIIQKAILQNKSVADFVMGWWKNESRKSRCADGKAGKNAARPAKPKRPS